mmetsp:Transcript_20678/g.57463  ORF Transcript_20678/g.57463 Transcript_20678/m.57463 type:complete len:296 (+) Transcript_20678:91-978(+)
MPRPSWAHTSRPKSFKPTRHCVLVPSRPISSDTASCSSAVAFTLTWTSCSRPIWISPSVLRSDSWSHRMSQAPLWITACASGTGSSPLLPATPSWPRLSRPSSTTFAIDSHPWTSTTSSVLIPSCPYCTPTTPSSPPDLASWDRSSTRSLDGTARLPSRQASWIHGELAKATPPLKAQHSSPGWMTNQACAFQARQSSCTRTNGIWGPTGSPSWNATWSSQPPTCQTLTTEPTRKNLRSTTARPTSRQASTVWTSCTQTTSGPTKSCDSTLMPPKTVQQRRSRCNPGAAIISRAQ